MYNYISLFSLLTAPFITECFLGNNKDESDEDFHESRKETVGKAPNKMASHAR